MSMKVVEKFPRPVREIENLFIPLSDGCRLAARIWLPEDAETNPVPAILEYLPYRKRDGTAPRDELTHPYFAGHGYASVRVDMRGNGESDGLMEDEYLMQEQEDGLEVIDWLSQQAWCTGKVGMIGISWGGFNGLQIAARRPEALEAIITLCSTDDRYADDVHYRGGALMLDNPAWASTMLSYSAAIPDPALVGERWREMWLERLKAMPLLLENWLSHQSRDDYWKHGSICEDYGAIRAAVYAVGGWADGYTNAIGRMMRHLECPKKALVGPWAHKYPHFARPGPAIGFLKEALRWWDYWLKGADTGIVDEPACTLYIEDAAPPRAYYEERKGAWVRLQEWPGAQSEGESWSFGGGHLSPSRKAVSSTPVEVDSPLTTGRASGVFCAMGVGPDLPTDQRLDDAYSVSEPLEEGFSILGAPTVELEVASDRSCGQLVARLNDVAPDGAVVRVTYGALNLVMRDSREHPEALTPGERYKVRIKLDDIGYRVPKGHRLRLSFSSAYFPLLWPPKEKARLTLFTKDASLWVPVHDGPLLTADPFPPPESARPIRLTELRAADSTWHVEEDAASGRVTTIFAVDSGKHRFEDHGLVVGDSSREEYSVAPNDPSSAMADLTWTYEVARGDVEVRVESHCRLTGNEERFLIEAEQTALENGAEVHHRTWRRKIPRSWV